MVSGEQTERYRGFTLSQIDWYFAAKRSGRLTFTATTLPVLRRMIDCKLAGASA